MIRSRKVFAAIVKHKSETIKDLVAKLDIAKKAAQFQYSYSIEKSNGKIRTIVPSITLLKDVQDAIQRNIFSNVKFPYHVTGSVKKRSGVINGKLHAGNRFFLQTDLSSFFDFVTSKMVFSSLSLLGFSKDVTHDITRICTYKGHLAQGPSTSPFLANLVGLIIDDRLLEICKRNKITYSRYVDDITFSSKINFKNRAHELLETVASTGFIYNHKKTFYRINTINATGVKISNKGVFAKKELIKKSKANDIDAASTTGMLNYIGYVKKVNTNFDVAEYIKAFKTLSYPENIYPRTPKILN